MATVSLPQWFRWWYYCNVFILIPDWIFIIFRPHTLTGGSLATYFSLMNLYAKYDTLFADTSDPLLLIIYTIGALDILFVIYASLFFSTSKSHPSFVVMAIVREAALLAKTYIYVAYSWSFILDPWKIPITIMNSTWIVVPLLMIHKMMHVFNISLQKKVI